jgi:hypothetical protein
MECKVFFTKQFSQQFHIVDLFTLYHKKLTWERECSLLPSTQPFLEWEDTVIRLKKRLRFGERVIFPEKPKMFLNTSSENLIFACPVSDCRGFVAGSSCGTCKRDVCKKCRELLVPIQMQINQRDDNEPEKKINTKTQGTRKHECDATTLASIQSISIESKSCPRCRAQILKSEGCDHMFCTNCRTHFDWVTGKILSSSSNHHYDLTTAFSSNIALFTKQQNTEQCNTDPFTDAIPSSVVPYETANPILYRALWKEPMSVRYLLRKKLNTYETELQHQEALLKIRLMYLRHQLTEEHAKSKVFQEDEKHEKNFRHRNLLEMYLNICNDLQRMVYVSQTKETADEALQLYKNLIDTCQTASKDTRDELGGERLEFSSDFTSKIPHVTL